MVRTWDLCLLKIDIYFQKIKCATKQNANKFWNKEGQVPIRTRNITDIIISLMKNKKHKKEQTQSSVFALHLILYNTKYTVTWKRDLCSVFPPIQFILKPF